MDYEVLVNKLSEVIVDAPELLPSGCKCISSVSFATVPYYKLDKEKLMT